MEPLGEAGREPVSPSPGPGPLAPVGPPGPLGPLGCRPEHQPRLNCRLKAGMDGASEDDDMRMFRDKLQKKDINAVSKEADAAENVAASQPDILTCGVCQKPFALGDIMKFIQHKVAACNKENYLAAFGDGDAARHHDGSDSDDQNGGGDRGDSSGTLPVPLGVVNARRPSISAPINSKKSLVPTSSSSAVRILCTPPPSLLDSDDPRCSTPIKRRGRSTSPLLRPSSLPAINNHLGLLSDDDVARPAMTRVNIKQEGAESGSAESSPDEARRSKLARIDVVDAESNTINSEPNNYVCSTCKQRLHSAWRLVQHVQNSHGIKIYVESSSAASPSDNSTSKTPAHSNNRSSSSNCSSSSACSSSSLPGPGTPLSLPPPSARLHSHPPTSSPLLDPIHHPFPVGGLLRHPFPPTSMSSPLGLGPLFPRPSSHDHFRMEQLVSEQFRLSQQSLGLTGATATSIAPPPPVSPFGPTSTSVAPTSTPSRPSSGAPPAPLKLEPQLDFYSQRLRQLAGTTSPGAASAANGSSPSPSPRKQLLTPPFSSSSTPGAAPAAVTPLSLNNSKDSTNSNSTSSSSSIGANNNNNNSSAVNNNNNINNNNTSVLNNNTSGEHSDSESRPPRPQSLTPPEKQSQLAETPTPANPTIAVTSTPRSASTPPDTDKPTDFSRTAKSLTAVDDDGERIHSCEFCGKKFRFQSSLIAHRRVHTGEKPYKCSVCDHACAQHSKLKRHMKTHRIGRDATNGTGRFPDQLSNAGSVETLDDDDDDDDEEEEDEDEDEEEEEDMELEDEDADDDDDLGGDAPEDLTTKSNSSTPPNNNNTSSGTDKGGMSPRPTPASTPMEKVASGSLVGELMDKFGLNHIAQYSEAYKQALQESVISPHPIGLKDDILQRSPLIVGDNNNIGKLPRTPSNLENGLLEKSAAALRFREEFAKNMLAAGQPPLDLVGGPHGIFGPGAPFDNPFDAASKRMKLDLDHGNPLGRPGDRDSLYAGLWLPTSHHLFPGADGSMDLLGSRGKSSDLLKGSNGPKAGPSASSLAAAAAAALNLGLPVSAQQHLKKEGRRNDTCEFCGKVFKNCSNLTVHRRSHTGEKPYKCELCSYACAQSSKLTRHMKTHGRLGKDVYRCRFCEMPFSVPSTLEKHMRKCVVNQNVKGGHHFLTMSGDEDSSLSAVKDT